MEIFSAIVTLLGGLAMFLYGIEVMGDGLKNSSGAALKKVLEKVTGSVVMGVLTGAMVTAVIQSSTATIVLTGALIGAGVLNLRQAVSIVMGANIGTTITAQIIRLSSIEAGDNWMLMLFDTDTLAPIALIVGIILLMFIKTKSSKTIGDIFIGFGILFVGLNLMTGAVKPLSETEAFRNVLLTLNNPMMGIAAGLILTVIVQSSSAMVGMIQALSVSGAMTFNMVYPMIMGINLGTCVTTAMVCSIGSSKDAKRTGVVHIIFNTIGTVLFMIVMTIMEKNAVFGAEYWVRVVDSGIIANFQTIFNLITAIVLLPFTNVLVVISKAVVKEEPEKAPRHPELLGLSENLFISPAVAISEATKAIASMSVLSQDNFAKAHKLLHSYDAAIAEEIREDENCIDQFTDTVDTFLINLSKETETATDDHEVNMLMQVVPDFERIGDYAIDLVNLSEKIADEKSSFSDSAKQELELISSAVDEILSITVEAFTNNSNSTARRIEPLEEVIDDMVRILKQRHTTRLKKGACSVSTGLVFIEILNYMERASDQCSSIAVLMLARENEEIAKNHYDYLRHLHEGNDQSYRRELSARRQQYISQLENIAI